MTVIKENISNFIESQFPEIYREEGPLFVEFVKQYYEWMEAQSYTNNGEVINNSNSAMTYHARHLLDYKDIDETVDDFIVKFKEKYLKEIQIDTASQTKQLMKHSLDLYRSKGTERAVDLFFRAVFGKPAEVYYPGEDLFRLSDGKWVKPKYLEVSVSEHTKSFVGKQIVGVKTGATAFVERFIRRKVKSKFINILYISAIQGNFETGELVTLPDVSLQNVPFVIGSLTTLDIVVGGQDFVVGDIVDVESTQGLQGKARVASVSDVTGLVDFKISESGWGYTTSPEILISEKVFTVSNVSATTNNESNAAFYILEQIKQPLANVTYSSANSTLALNKNDMLYTYYSNNSVAGSGRIVAVTQSIANASFNPNTDVSSNFITLETNPFSSGDRVHYMTEAGNTALTGLSNNTYYFVVSANTSGIKLATTFGGSAISLTPSSTSETGHKIHRYQGEVLVNNLVGNLEPVVQKNANLTGNVAVSNTSTPIIGTASINSTSNVVIGDGTTFTDLFVGAPIRFFKYEDGISLGSAVRIVTAITNTTSITVDSNVSFLTTNAAFAANQVQMQLYSKRVIRGDGTNFTSLAYGDKVGVYTNSSVYTIFTVNSAPSANVLTVQEEITFSNTNTKIANTTTTRYVYTASNTMIANITAYVDKTAVGNVVGIASNNYISLTEITGPFSKGLTVYQKNVYDVEVANATVLTVTETVGTNTTLLVANTFGAFKPSKTLYARYSNGAAANVTGNISGISMLVGLTDIVNTFADSENNYVYSTNSATTGSISRISQGSLASFDISNTLVYPETVTLGTDFLKDYADVPLDAVAYGFPALPSANLTSGYLEDIFSEAVFTVGALSRLTNVNPGKNYDIAPFILIYDPLVSEYNRHDYIFKIDASTGVFTPGELVSSATDEGIVVSANSTEMHIKRLGFENLFSVGDTVEGELSGATAHISLIEEDMNALPIGLNAVISANVQASAGSVTSLEVIDSGFGFLPDENAIFTSKDGLRSGIARVHLGKRGASEGYYMSKNSFLSDTKKLFDGEYYQEYSYEVRSSIDPDKYTEMLKKILHVAGTKQFDATIVTSIGQMRTNINTTIVEE